jgi:Transposase
MPRPYPPEFRARAIALIRAGKQAKQTAVELGIHPVTLSKWLRQDDIVVRDLALGVLDDGVVAGLADAGTRPVPGHEAPPVVRRTLRIRPTCRHGPTQRYP